MPGIEFRTAWLRIRIRLLISLLSWPLSIIIRHIFVYLWAVSYTAEFITTAWRCSPLRTSASQPTADLTFTCLKTEVKDHPISLGVTYGQHVELPGRCWLSKLQLPTQIISYPNYSRWVGTDTIYWLKIPHSPEIEAVKHPVERVQRTMLLNYDGEGTFGQWVWLVPARHHE